MNVPESRFYTHLACRQRTEIEGPEFESVANPLTEMTQTYCAHCEIMGPMSDFAWSDTGERISDFYARYAAKATPFDRMISTRTAMFVIGGGLGVVGLVIGMALTPVLGWLVGIVAALGLAVVGVVIGFIVHTIVIQPATMKRTFGVTDARLLR